MISIVAAKAEVAGMIPWLRVRIPQGPPKSGDSDQNPPPHGIFHADCPKAYWATWSHGSRISASANEKIA